MATFLQTQRRGLRGYLGQAWAKMGIETSAEASETPSRTKLCSKCRAISAKLEELLDRGFDGPDGIPIMGQRVTAEGDLKHVVKLFRRKRCSLCNFFAHMVEAYNVTRRGEFAASELSLWISSAKNEYGIPQDFSQVSDSFFLWIRLSRRVYPYGGPVLPYYFDELFRFSGMALELNNDLEKISGLVIGPQTNFELVRSWFDDCTMRHGNTCQTDTSILQGIPGFRVIDCSSRRLVPWSHLPTNPEADYVALSYVWGTEPDDGNEGKKDSSDRVADWRLPSKLPPLIEDVITAVIKLRFRYLWVDRYCIPQDNQDAKHTQIQNMDSVYGSATLTIIAAAGEDPSVGLPGVSLPRYGRVHKNENLSVSVRIGSRTFVTVGTADAPDGLKYSKWNSRAWTMQEAFLSCRCLVFLGDGAYFQCSSPRSHRFEAIHEPPALLQFRHEVLSREEHNNTGLPDSIIRTKARRTGGFQISWCLQLVKEYFPRSMTFENDSLNAFSGILKYLQSLEPPIHNLWGVLMLPDVASTDSGERISYNLVCGLGWLRSRDNMRLRKLRQLTILPRKDIFPSWSWVDWRSRTALDDGNYFDLYTLEFHSQASAFTSLVDLSVELHDGRIISWGKGYESDIAWLTTTSHPPRVLHIHGYTCHPQLRYITEEEWGKLCDKTLGHLLSRGNEWDWALIDADGEHLQQPFETTQPGMPWYPFHNLSIGAYQLQLQRASRAVADIETFHSSTFTFRVILLGYNQSYVFYMVLMKVPGTDGHTETFERVNVRHEYCETKPGTQRETQMAELLAKLTGKHANSLPGTPWVKMSTRIA